MNRSVKISPGHARAAAGPWPAWARAVTSLVVGLHILAVLAGAGAAAPSSELQRRFASLFRLYHAATNQGYGYRFYARLDTTTDPARPRPWGTPVVTAEMEFDAPEGGVSRREIRLPALEGPWPRLRRQREIGLAYHVTADPRWAASYARHLCKTYGCKRVTLATRPHNVPDLGDVRRLLADPSPPPADLHSEAAYGPRSVLGEFTCDQF